MDIASICFKISKYKLINYQTSDYNISFQNTRLFSLGNPQSSITFIRHSIHSQNKITLENSYLLEV